MAAARSRLAIALAALGIAFAACFGGDHGSARAAVGNATGPLIGSSVPGAAILTTHDLAPGRARVGEVTVTNVGDVSGDFSLGATGLVDAGPQLSGQLDLSVEDVTSHSSPSTVYSGKLAGLSSVDLGAIAQGAAHRYRFTVSLPSTVDDTFQGATSAVTFLWTATGADVVAPPPSGGTGGGGDAVTTPAPARTAEAPPVAKVAGKVVLPGASLDVRASQKAKTGLVAATATCQAACRVTLSGSTTVAHEKLELKASRKVLRKAGRVRMKLRLPAKARLALAAGRPVTVRLTVQAKVGTRVVTVRRTVRVMPASR